LKKDVLIFDQTVMYSTNTAQTNSTHTDQHFTSYACL